MIEVFFDVETQKLFQEIGSKDPEKLGVSILSVYKRILKNGRQEKGEIQSFWEDEIEKAWSIFEEADRLIGFNSLKFDVLVLKPYLPSKFLKLNHFDILEQIRAITGRRVSLDNLVKESLGKTKTDVGTKAVSYWKKHDSESLEKLKCYCESDVLITRDLYDYAMSNRILKFVDYWNNPRMIEVDFSYPKEEVSSTKQVGLF